jgi:hypothetical protein
MLSCNWADCELTLILIVVVVVRLVDCFMLWLKASGVDVCAGGGL